MLDGSIEIVDGIYDLVTNRVALDTQSDPKLSNRLTVVNKVPS